MRALDSIRHRTRRAAQRGPGDAAAGVPDPALIAAGISFLVPGLGQLVLRAWLPGALWLAGWLVLAAATGALHGTGAFVLMVAAAFDAYARGRRAAGGPAAHGAHP